ncbi:hexaprenyldihydroxybenzoate methyltransferase mitochondrial precursor [Plenodomus tracheiphilus IPT5]|uniref:Ubiquinone biosynthesis O-methyltransferase, mitochondrial n=1 Tax=Plenodomus tracheiphilus IPT5 TaxID=1408161 RepID=A0A6A7BF83_9PLEO|nr:hexaprenyldihydroxybenzoate methyltransferase mitochondrial precursor [Plenodomus tracheiphilus IPT5]
MKPQTPARAIRSMRRSISQTSRSRVPHNAPRIPSAPTSFRTFTCSAAHALNPNPNPTPPPHSTVDPTEVSHFNALASSWWDPQGPSRLLHLMNPLRHSFISSCRSTSPSDPGQKLRYLDIGCGGGIFAESAARLHDTESVVGIDPTPGVLSIASAHARRDPILTTESDGKKRLAYLNTSIENLPPPSSPQQGYDIVTCFEVLEHVHAPGPFLSHILPHVKPGGWLVMSTIARTWTSWLVTNVMAEDVLGIVPKGTHEWGKYVNEEELRGWFKGQEGWGGGVGGVKSLGVMYVPGLGWREVVGGEGWGNYFFGVRRDA